MLITITIEDFLAWIGELLRAEPRETLGEYTFSTRFLAEDPLHIGREEAKSIIETLQGKDRYEETVLFDNKTYEVLINRESVFRVPVSRFDGGIIKEDTDNGVVYRLSPPSDEYLMFILNEVARIASMRIFRMPFGASFRVRKFLEQHEAPFKVLPFIKSMLMPRLQTLRIESRTSKSLAELNRYSNAFLFQLSYNLDVSLVEVRYLDEFVRSGRITRDRRASIDETEVPKRFYIPDLIYHYQMAVATESPLLEFLSYYHVAEHFFEEVYNDDLIERVRDKITGPDFSYKRKKDIRGLINDINKRLKLRGDSFVFSEQEALRLTIAKRMRRPSTFHLDMINILLKRCPYYGSLLNRSLLAHQLSSHKTSVNEVSVSRL